MDPTTADITLAVFMVLIAVALVLWFERTEAVATLTRMVRMMARAGLDARIIAEGRPVARAVMRDARTRCGRCSCEDKCERWLEGEIEGANTFCPNARVFDMLALRMPRSA